MTSEEGTGSLADQAAAWVPPWARSTAPADPAVSAADAAPGATVAPDAEASSETSTATEPPTAAPNVDAFEEPTAFEESTTAPNVDAFEEPMASEPPAVAEPTASEPAVAEPAVAEAPAVAEPVQAGDPATGPAAGAAGLPNGSSMGGRSADRREEKLALLDDAELRGAVEAILLVVDEPATEEVLAQVLEQPAARVRNVLAELSGEYTRDGRGFELRRAAGGWRLYTRPEYASYVERFVLDGQSVRLTQAALETLAVVAYKQPVTRSRISAIRGVNCDGVIRTLLSRGLVRECGIEPDSGAHLYQTTTLFLEKLGIDSVGELPPLAPFLPDDVEEIADASR